MRSLLFDSPQRLTEMSRYAYELANMNFRASQPFVGASAFAHKGGMHVHAVQSRRVELRTYCAGIGRKRNAAIWSASFRAGQTSLLSPVSTTCKTIER